MDASEERITPAAWESFRQAMGYSEEELAVFRSNPRREFVLQHADRLDAWKITAEVVASHGCAAGHQVGDRFCFSPHGTTWPLKAQTAHACRCSLPLRPLWP